MKATPAAYTSTSSNMLAVDLGAESGRVMLGRFDGQCLHMSEVYRFPNKPVTLPNGMYWDILRLYGEILTALSAAGATADGVLDSLGIDTWAVDFGLLDRTGALIENPRHYRDRRTEGVLDRVFRRVPRADIYHATGIQTMPINTLCQLLAMEDTPTLSIAHTMLLIPDLFRYWLSGEQTAEYTVATTTQLYNHAASTWAWDVIDRLGLPSRLFPPLVPTGKSGRPILANIARDAGLQGSPTIVAVASHDTASAVVAVPAQNERFAFISSGTWSLVGVELSEPVLSNAAIEANFTNEGGAFKTIRFLKNVMGLWLLQECRRSWSSEGRDVSYDSLVAAVGSATPFSALIDPDYPAFLGPGDMPARIAAYCQMTGQRPPEGIAAVTRCILESLALRYRWVIDRIEELTNRSLEAIHIVGGGSRNTALCQFTADATRRPVVAGPAEATALGNILVQAVSRGYLSSLDEVREVVRNSAELAVYEPCRDSESWDEAYNRFLAFTEATVDQTDL